jgi:hypothetical protein
VQPYVSAPSKPGKTLGVVTILAHAAHAMPTYAAVVGLYYYE